MDKKGKTERENDDVLNILQKFGKYQILQYLYICLPTIFIAMGNVNYVFVAGDADYRCRVPECDSVDNSFTPSWWPYTMESLDSKLNRCRKPVLNKTYFEENKCDNSSFTSEFVECEEWIYANNNSVVVWLNLACNPWKTNLIGTIHSLGTVLGMTLGGVLADRFGRKTTFIMTGVAIVIGNVKTFIWSYYGYLFIELVESVIAGSAYSAGMVLIVEISGNDQRTIAAIVFAYAIYLGEALLAGMALILPFWKSMVYIICTPPILVLFLTKLMEESPRWLVLNDRLDDARRILKLITKLNKVNISINDLNKLNEEKLRKTCNVEMEPKKEGYKEAFASREIVKRLIIATVGRFTVAFTYYGLIAYSVWLPGSKYTNYSLTALMSFPGDIIALYCMNKWGRKMPLFYGYFVCGVACVTSAYIPESYNWLRILIYLIGKLMSAACYTGIWIYTMELFPTSIRGSMYGLSSLIATPGYLLAPLTPAMDTISPVFASILFSGSAVASSILMLFAPETKDQPLAGTIQDITYNIAIAKRPRRSIDGNINTNAEADIDVDANKDAGVSTDADTAEYVDTDIDAITGTNAFEEKKIEKSTYSVRL
ncbi:unnamed protein product [Euphydryas editha]|uniref:Major facilitator superfamily (MFS) profile domain-containing protein n=1 Tax=Euphydryas editha TaxID=104508 RepID=A0AAU9V9Z2_EUPED|nr:unnamed protein product [Euphydryas editha]